MNQKEVSELRRRFRPEKSGISKIYGCYVGGNKEIISYVDSSLGLMTQEESELYLGLLKKTLSGGLGRNLMDIVFSTAQVADSDEHRLLQTLRTTALEDGAAREIFYQKLIQTLDLDGSNYVILMAADSYDVPYRSRDGRVQEDAGDQVFQYLVCCVCPVKDGKLALRYDTDLREFHTGLSGRAIAAPEIGFLFPAFDDRAANIYNALYYCHNPAQVHQEVIDAIFCTKPVLSAPEQKETFESVLLESVAEECSYDVVQSVHEQIRERMEEHKQQREPEMLELTLNEVGTILKSSGVSERGVEAFTKTWEEQCPEEAVLNPGNIVENRKFQIATPEVKISMAPEYSGQVETRRLNGRPYLLIPAEGSVTVNGIAICLPEEPER